MDRIIGESRWAQDIRKSIDHVARHNSSVLITGPSGTGKELIARSIHEQSSRIEQPFVPVDCASIPSNLAASQLFGHRKGAFTGADYPSLGFFRAADGGTIFLDEVGELNLELQAKLLRVIQEREVVPVGAHEGEPINVRLLAATNRDLCEMVQADHFRLDLYYRLNVIPLQSKPLCKRIDDIEMLANHFLARFSVEIGQTQKALAPRALETLQRHNCPGNVRQLQNVLERAVVFCDSDQITDKLICRCMGKPQPAPTPNKKVLEVAPHHSDHGHWPTLDQVERDQILRTLKHFRYNRSAAARQLQIDYRRLCRLIRKHNLNVQSQSPSQR